MPTRAEWDELNSKYKRQLKSVLSGDSVAADSSRAGIPADDNGNDVSSEAQEAADAADTEQNNSNSDTINDNLQSANEEPGEKIAEDQSTEDQNSEANEKALLIQIFISLYLQFFPHTP